LDALSLRVRAVRAMLSIDAARAREMFGQMPVKLPLSALSRKDATVYDVSDFYVLAGEIALKTFSAEEAGLLRYFYASELVKALNTTSPATREDFPQKMIYSGDAALSTPTKEAKLKL
ncbi:MAG: hypothetical protein ACJ74T_20425, partial [Pyrinomonadaceae bacterium]